MEGIVIVSLLVLFYIIASKLKFRTVHHYHEDMESAILAVKEWFPFGLRTRIRQYKRVGGIWYNKEHRQVSGGVARALTTLVKSESR